MIIRSAEVADAEALLAIYRPYVEDTAVTFEYDVPLPAAFACRIGETLKKYPYLVLEDAGEILGYAYAGAFKDRPAYDWAAETTIYLRQDARGKGYGRRLYTALEEALQARGVLNAYACIAYTETEDAYLTNSSQRFHQRMGYALAGRFRQCGYKFGRWYDMIWMEKFLGDHGASPRPFHRA